ncbi:Protein arginine methyltransferase NDUFAF7, mitochondrial [Psilocybe cubensis]|uniref:Protein arginine methyltransferase NDUFAF7 n=2 Tax=Psilocybe cubensis TaxID=181762 RepID=A0A8H7Y0S6_PSICU|nr:Protein arginine methyltransferase NDUFAF7, mitochondrial [Psilocybe cubensis]KAH9481716.1 Protein arginine methyltransferase NDUFAF7, mitochondrial [Psilocybe cubensis]
MALTRICWRLSPPVRLLRRTVKVNTRWNSTLVPNTEAGNVAPTTKHTKIEKIILDHIKTTGPISFATYMQLCLSHPTDGYYMNPEHKVFGSGGDFITSPEISQTFGELVALWLLQEFRKSGKDVPLRLVELGPGKGTLMGDILRVVRKFEPHKQINVHLVETSPTMRALQKNHLSDTPGVHIHWHNSINELVPSASEYTMLVAHEFFDALPVHVLQKSKDTGVWHEVLIASTEEVDRAQSQSQSHASESETPASPTSDVPAAFSTATTETPPPPSPSSSSSSSPTTESITPPPLSTPPQPPTPSSPYPLRRVLASKPSSASTVLGLSSPRFSELSAGSLLEVSPTSYRVARKVGELLATGTSNDGTNEVESGKENPIGGCGLIIDYGGASAYGDSLRAFKNHAIVDVFHEPGQCDITANVDFAFLREAMADIVTPLGPIPQGVFLARMGLGLRLRTLLQAASTEERRQEIHSAAMRLIDPKGMGGEYKVLGITSGVSKGVEEPWPFVVGEAKEQK